VNSKPSDQTAEGRTRKGSATSLPTLGERLRLAREARGVSLRQISDQTRIQMRYLEAIEANDYKRLPGGIFNRSFIKAYAKAVGFDETEALNAYARISHETKETEEESLAPRLSRVYTDGEKERSPGLTLLLTIAILGILLLGIYAAHYWYQKRNESGTAQTPVTTNIPSTTQPTPQPTTGGAAPTTNNLQIQVTARNEPVWIRTRIDDGTTSERTLAPNEEARFTPERRLSIQYARSKAAALQVTINGRPARVPTETSGQQQRTRTNIEMVIDENYEQLLQQ
jgi:cytoskeleton protein RodZ